MRRSLDRAKPNTDGPHRRLRRYRLVPPYGRILAASPAPLCNLVDDLLPGLAGVSIRVEFGAAYSNMVNLVFRRGGVLGLEAIPQLFGELYPLGGRQVTEVEDWGGHDGI
jgi:hypothetical protein